MYRSLWMLERVETLLPTFRPSVRGRLSQQFYKSKSVLTYLEHHLATEETVSPDCESGGCLFQ